jgi:hypothetical protein
MPARVGTITSAPYGAGVAVSEPREGQRRGRKPRAVPPPPGQPEPAQRGGALRRGQAVKKVDGDDAAVTLGGRV